MLTQHAQSMVETASYDTFAAGMTRLLPTTVEAHVWSRVSKFALMLVDASLYAVHVDSSVHLHADGVERLSEPALRSRLRQAVDALAALRSFHELDDAGSVVAAAESLVRALLTSIESSVGGFSVVAAMVALADSYAVDWLELHPTLDRSLDGSWASAPVQFVCTVSLRLWREAMCDAQYWEELRQAVGLAWREPLES